MKSFSTEEQNQLIEALQKRLKIIADHEFRDRDPESHLEQLKLASEEIDSIYKSYRPQMSGDLRHYLSQMSYQKALNWLTTHQN